MKHKIILFGTKSSGKTTTATAIYGLALTQKGIIPNANFDEYGKMTIIYDQTTQQGVEFNIDTREPHLLDFFRKNVWDYVKHASFADALKESVARIFSIDLNLIYGSEKDKNTETHIKMSDIIQFIPEDRRAHYQDKGHKYATVRKLLEIFGTDICRALDDECHIRSAHTALELANPEIGIIQDGRFENEFYYSQEERDRNAKSGVEPCVHLIKLRRRPYQSSAPSEAGLPTIDESLFDLVVPEDLTMAEKNNFVIEYLTNKGALSKSGVHIE